MKDILPGLILVVAAFMTGMTYALVGFILALTSFIPWAPPLGNTMRWHSSVGYTNEADSTGVVEAYGKLPLLFVENQGQLDAEVRYYVKASVQTVYVTDDGIVFDLVRYEPKDKDAPDSADRQAERLVFTLDFVGERKPQHPGEEQRRGHCQLLHWQRPREMA